MLYTVFGELFVKLRIMLFCLNEFFYISLRIFALKVLQMYTPKSFYVLVK